MQALDQAGLAEHDHVATAHQAGEQRQVKQRDKAQAIAGQCLQPLQGLLAAHQRGREVAEEVHRPAVEHRQHVFALEQAVDVGEARIGNAHRQDEIVLVAQHALGQHQADFLMLLQGLGLMCHALREQPVVVAQHLDQLATGQLDGAQQVADKAQVPGIAHIAHTGLIVEGVDDRLDLLAFAVVADQHLQCIVGLAQCALQGHGEEPRAVGGDDDTDERLFVHVDDLAKKSAPHLTVTAHD